MTDTPKRLSLWQVMDLSSAINVIESVAGFTDADTAVGEAWEVVMAQLKAAPVPVAVSERLPKTEDCDKESRCWWLTMDWEVPALWEQSSAVTHWLPAHALPLPSGETQP